MQRKGPVASFNGGDLPDRSCCWSRSRPGGRGSCSAEGSGRGKGREPARTFPPAFVSGRQYLRARLWAPRSAPPGAPASFCSRWPEFGAPAVESGGALVGWQGQAEDENTFPRTPWGRRPQGGSPPRLRLLPGLFCLPSGCRNLLHVTLKIKKNIKKKSLVLLVRTAFCWFNIKTAHLTGIFGAHVNKVL